MTIVEFITIFLIAIGLCFDSFAVSVSSGLMMKHISFLQAMRISFSLAFFQGVMPLIGWFAGKRISDYLANYDHWIAFGLLLIIGIRMLLESRKKDEDKTFNPLNIWYMIYMSLATSIDALIVGFSFAFINTNIYISILIIGTVTFISAMLGILFGKKAGILFGKKMEILGGLILIVIGFKILFEHLFFT
ncbi:MAG: manganese efflux pump MntP family protein [Bacteroidota bacterium]|nr:manganese efflux pump MntP family protein [Bacteroidota bacterium]